MEEYIEKLIEEFMRDYISDYSALTEGEYEVWYNRVNKGLRRLITKVTLLSYDDDYSRE